MSTYADQRGTTSSVRPVPNRQGSIVAHIVHTLTSLFQAKFAHVLSQCAHNTKLTSEMIVVLTCITSSEQSVMSPYSRELCDRLQVWDGVLLFRRICHQLNVGKQAQQERIPELYLVYEWKIPLFVISGTAFDLIQKQLFELQSNFMNTPRLKTLGPTELSKLGNQFWSLMMDCQSSRNVRLPYEEMDLFVETTEGSEMEQIKQRLMYYLTSNETAEYVQLRTTIYIGIVLLSSEEKLARDKANDFVQQLKGKESPDVCDRNLLTILYHLQGRLEWNSGNYEEATKFFQSALSIDIKFVPSWKYIGKCYIELNKAEMAIDCLTEAIEIKPDMSSLYFYRGTASYTIERYTDALDNFEKDIALNPDQARSYATRGKIHLRNSKWTDALKDLSKAMEVNPNDASVIADRAETFFLLERYEDAVADFNVALKSIRSPLLFKQRAICFSLLEKHQEALDDFGVADEQLLDKTRKCSVMDHYMFKYQKALSMIALRMYSEALEELNEILVKREEGADTIDAQSIVQTHISLAECYSGLEEVEKAESSYQTAIQLDTQNSRIYFSRGKHYAKLKEWEKALADFSCVLEKENSVKKSPIAARAHHYRSEVFEAGKMYNYALIDAEYAHKLDPGNKKLWARYMRLKELNDFRKK